MLLTFTVVFSIFFLPQMWFSQGVVWYWSFMHSPHQWSKPHAFTLLAIKAILTIAKRGPHEIFHTYFTLGIAPNLASQCYEIQSGRFMTCGYANLGACCESLEQLVGHIWASPSHCISSQSLSVTTYQLGCCREALVGAMSQVGHPSYHTPAPIFELSQDQGRVIATFFADLLEILLGLETSLV